MRRHGGAASGPGESRLTLPGAGTNHKALKALPAQVAELVDAQVSGTCGRKLVEVRVFSWAPPKWGIIEQASVSIHLHRGDLPPDIDFTGVVAIDTETMGLNPHRDRLCLVQLSAGDGVCHLVQLAPGQYEAPRLRALLVDPTVLKLFHFGRFDIAVLRHHLGVLAGPVYCTKIASKLVRTFTDRHGLKDLCRDLLGVDLSKQQQSSDWGAAELGDAAGPGRLREGFASGFGVTVGRNDFGGLCPKTRPYQPRQPARASPSRAVSSAWRSTGCAP